MVKVRVFGRVWAASIGTSRGLWWSTLRNGGRHTYLVAAYIATNHEAPGAAMLTIILGGLAIHLGRGARG